MNRIPRLTAICSRAGLAERCAWWVRSYCTTGIVRGLLCHRCNTGTVDWYIGADAIRAYVAKHENRLFFPYSSSQERRW